MVFYGHKMNVLLIRSQDFRKVQLFELLNVIFNAKKKNNIILSLQKNNNK